MTTIYLSSTYEDLKEYRAAVFEALRKAGYNVLAMEDYVATDRRPVEKCLADVAEADIYVGLFAFRYGYVPPREHGNPNGLSITELEFRHAEKLKKPCLAFTVSEDASWPRKFDDSRTDKENKGERINQLRDYLTTEKTASLFSSPHQLASLVQAAVTKQLEVIKKADEPRIKEPEPSPKITWDIKRDGSPYPGLMHFTRKYAPVFFGREAEVREILDRMSLPEGRFIIISGDSGVGKSSIVDAGILPKLKDSGLPGNEGCECVRMVPGQGSQPFAALMTALGSFATCAGLRPDTIIEELKKSADTLTQHLRKIMAGGTEGRTLVLFLDQMEELFTAQDIEQSSRFLTALYGAAQEKAVWVIGTLRSDHLHFCHSHPEMLQVLRGPGHYPLGRVEQFMMQDMIIKPANRAGLKVSDNLARRIVNDAGAESGNLPLLAFVLDQLFKKRSDHELSEDVYKALGGVGGAVTEHVKMVEETIPTELGDKAPELLRRIFQSLVIVNPEGLPTRRRPLFAEFPRELRPAVELLIRERLLQTEGGGEASTVAISHEKLFEAWPALRDYISVNRKSLMDQTLLESRARKWEELGKPRFSGLASGREYRDFLRADLRATPLSKEYLNTSRRAVWIRTMSIVLPLVLVASIGMLLWKEVATIPYVASIVLARLHLAPVTEPKMQNIPGGTFRQGNIQFPSGIFVPAGEDTERPVREVKLRPFKIAKYEVTFEEYNRFAELTGRKPSADGWDREKRPVINVSWEEALAYAKWLSRATGKSYRLPTESEWEYAARAQTETKYWWGNEFIKGMATCFRCGHRLERPRTAPVGSFPPNPFGLYDTAGNVWEFVEDCWHDGYLNAPTDGRAWLKDNGGKCGMRVIRGGSFETGPESLSSSNRSYLSAGTRNEYTGFRLAQDID